MNEKRHISLMGIINLTDDSFFSGSRHLGESILPVALKMIEDGAEYLDLGACSTRPGSAYVNEDEEWKRIEPALCELKGRIGNTSISIDTFRASIVQKAYDIIGPFTVNDISAGEEDANMLQTVGKLGLEYIAMHKRGVPATMQSMCDYGPDGVIKAINDYFDSFSLKAEKAGIKEWILDPGFGFAKTVEQNFEILDSLDEFKGHGRRILVGISRKSFIYKPLGLTPETCLPQVQDAHLRALKSGGDILRVHDVAEAAQTVQRYLTLSL